MTLTKGNRYRWRVRCQTGLIFEHDDVRVVIATAMKEAGLGWHPPTLPWFFSPATVEAMRAAEARHLDRLYGKDAPRPQMSVRSPFVLDLDDEPTNG
jgi:hypothetical protein